MKLFSKISLIFAILFILATVTTFLKNPANAAGNCGTSPALITTTQTTSVFLQFNDPSFANRGYQLVVKRPSFVHISERITTDSNGNFTKDIGPFNDVAIYTVEFRPQNDLASIECSNSFSIQTTSGPGACPAFNTYFPATIYESDRISAIFESVTGSDPTRIDPASFGVRIGNENPINLYRLSGGPTGPGGWQATIGRLSKGTHRARLYFAPNTIPPTTPSICIELPIIKIQAGTNTAKNPCRANECPTALGNIPTDPQGFAGQVLTIALGLAGGLAFILMVIGAIKVMTSSGDQQKLTGGRDMIAGAISGLLFLIFSVLILRFAGIIANIPFV